MLIRVLIVDDHEIFRRGVRSVISEEEDMTVVAEASNASEALDAVRKKRPDVVTLDIRLGGMDGIQLARALCELADPPSCIMLSTYEDRQYLVGALEAGAMAYLLKSNSYDTLPNAVRAVHSGEHILSPELVSKMMTEYRRIAAQQIQRDSGLSPQEVEILRLLAAGGRSLDIASDLAISEVTVKRKVQDISIKLNASNRVQAVAEAIRRGVI